MDRPVQRNHELQVDHEAYRALPRHPIRLVAFNHLEPNIAGVIRSAEAFRVEQLFLMRKPRTVAPAAGEGRLQPTTFTHDLIGVIAAARADGYTVVALEQTDRSVHLTRAELPYKICLVAGDEGDGVPARALALAELAVEIPQFGKVPSLNVASAVSIALYEWIRQHAR